MSIAEKLQAIAENEQKVYQAGYAKGQLEGDAAFVMSKMYLGGYAFHNAEFPQDYDLVLNVFGVKSLSHAFENTKGVKSIKITSSETVVSTNNGLSMMDYAFLDTSAEIIDISGIIAPPSTLASTFRQAANLKRIIGALDCTSLRHSTEPLAFYKCGLLEDVSFVPETIKLKLAFDHCPLLSDASIESIINGLADLTGTTSQNVYFHSTVLNKLTTEQCQRITDKNWTFA